LPWSQYGVSFIVTTENLPSFLAVEKLPEILVDGKLSSKNAKFQTKNPHFGEI